MRREPQKLTKVEKPLGLSVRNESQRNFGCPVLVVAAVVAVVVVGVAVIASAVAAVVVVVVTVVFVADVAAVVVVVVVAVVFVVLTPSPIFKSILEFPRSDFQQQQLFPTAIQSDKIGTSIPLKNNEMKVFLLLLLSGISP